MEKATRIRWEAVGAIAGVMAVVITIFGIITNRSSDLRPIPPTETTTNTIPTTTVTPTATFPTTATATPTTTSPERTMDLPPDPVPSELIGYWRGGGNQYAYDDYYMTLEVDFTAEGEYSMLRGGAGRDVGYFEVDGSLINFRSTQGQPYTLSWGITEFSGRPILNLSDEGGGSYSLDKL